MIDGGGFFPTGFGTGPVGQSSIVAGLIQQAQVAAEIQKQQEEAQKQAAINSLVQGAATVAGRAAGGANADAAADAGGDAVGDAAQAAAGSLNPAAGLDAFTEGAADAATETINRSIQETANEAMRDTPSLDELERSPTMSRGRALGLALSAAVATYADPDNGANLIMSLIARRDAIEKDNLDRLERERTRQDGKKARQDDRDFTADQNQLNRQANADAAEEQRAFQSEESEKSRKHQESLQDDAQDFSAEQALVNIEANLGLTRLREAATDRRTTQAQMAQLRQVYNGAIVDATGDLSLAVTLSEKLAAGDVGALNELETSAVRRIQSDVEIRKAQEKLSFDLQALSVGKNLTEQQLGAPAVDLNAAYKVTGLEPGENVRGSFGIPTEAQEQAQAQFKTAVDTVKASDVKTVEDAMLLIQAGQAAGASTVQAAQIGIEAGLPREVVAEALRLMRGQVAGKDDPSVGSTGPNGRRSLTGGAL